MEPRSSGMKRLDFVFFDAGGGHRSAASALREVIVGQGREWDIRMVNLQELLDPLDLVRKLSGIRTQDVYNLVLKNGWTLGSPQLLAVMHGLIRLLYHGHFRLLEPFWRQSRPDMAVSLVPNFNRVMHDSLARALPGVPLVTILTDIADYPPRFWMEKVPQYLICGSPKAERQAREMGHAPERIFRTSGMILNPRFYEPAMVDRSVERQRLGLDPSRRTGLVLFGGHGSRTMLDIARRLNNSGLPVQLILICGHNRDLAEKLRKLPKKIPMFVEGFTREVPYYMSLSDFFIGKPGPGSISEALAMKLPVIVERNAWTLPQERYNADWLIENQYGTVLRSFRGIAAAVAELLRAENYGRYRKAIDGYRNQAVFEIPEILGRILTRRCPTDGAAHRGCKPDDAGPE